MATVQLTGISYAAGRRAAAAACPLSQFEGLRPAGLRVSTSLASGGARLPRRSFRGLVVKAATVVAPKYTSVKPLGDRVLVKIKSSEEKTVGGILLPSTAQTKPQSGEVVAVGDGRTIGKNQVDISVKIGSQVVYSKYAGTEIEFNGSNHLILKEDDIVGILNTDDVKDLEPLNERVLIKLAEAEEKTAGGLLLTDATKEKPSIGTVIAVGPGPLDEEGKRKPLTVSAGISVLYSKYAGLVLVLLVEEVCDIFERFPDGAPDEIPTRGIPICSPGSFEHVLATHVRQQPPLFLRNTLTQLIQMSQKLETWDNISRTFSLSFTSLFSPAMILSGPDHWLCRCY